MLTNGGRIMESKAWGHRAKGYCHLDGHSSAVKTLRKEGALPAEAVESCGKFHLHLFNVQLLNWCLTVYCSRFVISNFG